MSELAAGFRAGTAMAESALGAYDRTRARREEEARREQLAELEARRQAQIDAQQAQVGLEQQAIQQGTPLASAVAPDPMMARLGGQPLPAGQMSPVAPQQTQLGGQPVAMRFQQSADQLPTMSEQDYLREQARIYGLTGDAGTAASLRREALGYDTRALEQERYETERAEDARRFESEQELAGRRVTALETQTKTAADKAAITIKQLKQQIDAFGEDRNTAQASIQGQRIFRENVMTGGDLSTTIQRINEAYPEESPQKQAALAAARDAALTDAGMTAAKVGNLYTRQVEPVRNVLAREFKTEDEQLKAYNKTISNFVDSNTFDNVPATIRKNEETGMFEVLEGDSVTASFSSMGEIKDVATQRVEAIGNDPVQFAMDYQQRAKKAMDAQVRAIDDLGERQKAFYSFIEKNPEVIRDEEQMRELEKTYGIGGKPDVTGLGDDGPSEKKPKLTIPQQLAKREKEARDKAVSEEQAKQDKIASYADITPDMIPRLTMPEIKELERNIEFLPRDLADAINERILFDIQSKSGLGSRRMYQGAKKPMPIYTIKDLRQQMVEAGRATEQASDAELVTKYGELIGENPFELADYFGVESGTDSSAFGAGISAGADTLQSLGYSALAAGSRALGAEDTSESFMRSAEAEQYEAFLTGKPEYERIEDQDSLGDYLGYGAYQIGKQLPIMGGITAASLATGGVGAAAGLGLRTGMAIGGAGTGYGVGVGSLYQSAYEAEQQGTPVNMGEIFAKAVPYAAAEALLPTALARTVTSTGVRPAATSRLGAGVQAGLGGVVTEGATELAQTELEISMNPYLSEEEKFSQRLNAVVAGGVSGGAISGGVGLLAGARKTGTEEKDLATTQPQEETFVPTPTQQEEFDLGRAPFLEGEMQDELGTPDTGLVDTGVAEVDPYVEQKLAKEEFDAQRKRKELHEATTPPIEQIELVDDGAPQLQLDFTDVGEVSTINSELAKFDGALKESIAERKTVPVGRRKVEEKKLAVVQTELDKIDEQLSAIKTVGFGRKNKKAKVARAKALEASKKALEAKRDEIQGKLDLVDAGKQASEQRKELRKATKAYAKGVAFNELTTEQQALLRQASPTIAFNNPEQTATQAEQVEEVAPTQEAEQVEMTSEVVEQEKCSCHSCRRHRCRCGSY